MSTEKVNGAERYSITYGTGKAYRGVIPDVTVTDALGCRTYQYMRVGDRVASSKRQPAPNDPRIPSSMARASGPQHDSGCEQIFPNTTHTTPTMAAGFH